MALTKEKTYGIKNYHGYEYVTNKEEAVMSDGRKLDVPSKYMEAFIQRAIKQTPEVHSIPQFVFVVKMLFGRIPLSAEFHNID